MDTVNTMLQIAIKDYAQERQRSKILSETPWFSTVISDVSDLTSAVESTHFLSHLVSWIRLQEDWIFRDQSREARAIRQGLGWTARNEELAIIDNSAITTGRMYDDLLQFVCSYRLVDVLVQYERLHGDNRSIPKNPAIPGSAKIKHWKKLEDIRDLLLTAKTLVLKVKATSQVVSNSPPLPIHIQLLRQIVGVQTQTNSLKVLKNVLLAAFGLAWMSNSAISLSPLKRSTNTGSSPATNWDSAILVGAQGINKDELKAFKELFKVSTEAALRLPIHMALTTTPLILLIPISLTGTRDSKMDILSVMRDMGNIRPQGLRDIESLVWGMILKIARGERKAPDALEELMSCIPWNIVEAWGSEDPNRNWFRPASMSLAAENPMGPLLSATNGTMRAERIGISSLPAPQVGPSIAETSSHGPGTENEGVSPEDVNMEDGESLGPGNKGNLSGDAMRSADAETAVGIALGPDEGGPDGNMGMEDGEGRKTVPGLEDKGDSSGDATTSADRSVSGFEDEGGSRRDVSMGDGESHLESRTPALRPEENGDSGGDDMSADAGISLEPEDEEYSCRDTDVTMADAENSVARAPGAMTIELNRNHSAGDELQNPAEPVGTRFSHRLRQTVTNAPVSELLAAPEGGFDEDHRNTPARPRKVKKKESATRQKRDPSMPLGLWEIIDVDALEDREIIDLNIEEQPPKIEADMPIIAYDGMGMAHSFTPRVHDKDIMDSIHSVARHLKEDYVYGKPPHTIEGALSVFHILTQEEYDKKSVREIQEILRRQHIVVVGRQQPRVKFDANGLRTLTRLNEPVCIQDQSIPLSAGGDANERVKKGTLRQMLNCSQQANGKVLNALSFPMPGAATTAEAFASDLAAWKQTTGEPGCSPKVEQPTGDIRWKLCATSGAWHGYHIDADGSGTFIEVEEGKKLWITSDHSVESRHTLAEIGIFFDQYFSVDEGAPKLWGLEAIVLVPGTRLIMRPDTPHAVITIEHSICYGGHFVAMSCMTDTLFGMTHAFMADSYITNTHHTKSRLLLRRMVIFAHQGLVDQALEDDDPDVEHLPNPADMDSLMDLISLCIIGVLINVLDFRTYTHRAAGEEMSKFEEEQLARFDCNGLTSSERQACQYVRGLALRMLQWIDDHYCVKDAEAKTVEGFAFTCLFNFVEALRIYMREAEQQDGVSSAPNCTRVSLDHQLESLFPPDSPLGLIRAQVTRGILEVEYLLPRTKEYAVAESKKPEKPSSRISLEEAMLLGETAADRRFKEGLKTNFPMEGPDPLDEKPGKRRKR